MEQPTYKMRVNIKADFNGIGLDGEKWVDLAQERGGGGVHFFSSANDYWHH